MEKNINLIIQKITGLTKGQLFLNPKINPKYEKEIENSINRLKKGEPIEYIINNAEFYSLDFFVDNRVLIPRDDTEIMVDKAIESIITSPQPSPLEEREQEQIITLIDVGTGSSCIPISILKNTQKIDNCFVIDISKDALEASKINIEMYNFDDKIEQIEGDLLDTFLTPSPSGNPLEKGKKLPINKNVVITANLPYIKDNDYENIDKQTAEYEPDIALFGGKETGFELYEKLIIQCMELKKVYKLENITLFIEIGFDQKETCENFVNKLGFKYEIFKDGANIDRCVKIEF